MRLLCWLCVNSASVRQFLDAEHSPPLAEFIAALCGHHTIEVSAELVKRDGDVLCRHCGVYAVIQHFGLNPFCSVQCRDAWRRDAL